MSESLWHTVWSAYNENSNGNDSSVRETGNGAPALPPSWQLQQLQRQQRRQQQPPPLLPLPAPPTSSAVSLEAYDELVRALTRTASAPEGGSSRAEAAAVAGELEAAPRNVSLAVLPRRRVRRVAAGSLDAASLPLASLKALLSLHGATAGHRAGKSEILDGLAGVRVRLPEVVAVAAPGERGGSGGGGSAFSSSVSPGVTSADLAAIGWAVPSPRLDAALAGAAREQEAEAPPPPRVGVAAAGEVSLPPPPAAPPAAAASAATAAACSPPAAATAAASSRPPPSKRFRSSSEKEGEKKEEGENQQQQQEQAARQPAEEEEKEEEAEAAALGEGEYRCSNTVKIVKGTLVWAPLGAAYWPAEVSEDATATATAADLNFPPPPSPSSSSASAVLVKVVVLGLQLSTRAPLVSLRPIMDGFERRAAETSRATAAGRVAVELARERLGLAEEKKKGEEDEEEDEMMTGE